MFKYEINHSGAQAALIARGDLTTVDLPGLKAEVKRLMEDGVTQITMDCAGLDLIDSTGIGFLVAMHNSLSRVKGSLEIVQVQADIYDLLCSMRLDRHIKISPLSNTQE